MYYVPGSRHFRPKLSTASVTHTPEYYWRAGHCVTLNILMETFDHNHRKNIVLLLLLLGPYIGQFPLGYKPSGNWPIYIWDIKLPMTRYRGLINGTTSKNNPFIHFNIAIHDPLMIDFEEKNITRSASLHSWCFFLQNLSFGGHSLQYWNVYRIIFWSCPLSILDIVS